MHPELAGISRPQPSYVAAYRFQFFIPREYNPDPSGQRAPIPSAKFASLNRKLGTDFPGLTTSRAQPATGQGLWTDRAGTIQPDECYLYDIVVEPKHEYREYFASLLEELLKPPEADLGFGQEAVLLLLTPIEVLYLQRPTE